MRVPVNRLADSRLAYGGITYVFEFAWRSPILGLGAAHAMDVGFVFDLVNAPDFVRMTGTDAPQQLADDMHRAWVAFATTGDPGWQPWAATRPVQVFDAPVSRVVLAPRDDERTTWNRPDDQSRRVEQQ